MLYLSLVLSELDYCTTVWSGTSFQNVLAIERVQRAATRYKLNYPDMCYKDRLRVLNLLPLSYRRDVADVPFMCRCINNMYNLNLTNFIKFTHNSTVMTRNSTDATMLCVPFLKHLHSKCPTLTGLSIHGIPFRHMCGIVQITQPIRPVFERIMQCGLRGNKSVYRHFR